MAGDPFLQAAAGSTQVVRVRQSACPVAGRAVRPLVSAFIKRAVTGAPTRPKVPSPGVALPGLFDTPPSPVPPVASRWLRTSAIAAEFAQGVLHGCGPAQVGFGVAYPPFIASPFLPKVNLVPSHYGSRAPFGAQIGLSGELATN